MYECRKQPVIASQVLRSVDSGVDTMSETRIQDLTQAMSKIQTNSVTFPLVRTYHFDNDDLPINSKDIYIEIYNSIL